MKPKYLLISSGILAGISNHTVVAAPAIEGTFYGKINTAIVVEETSGSDDTHLSNNSSYAGFKGKTALDDKLSVIYQLEYEIAPDETAAASGNSGIFKQRDAFIGLDTPVGAVVAGSHDTPLKLAQGKIDQFNNLPVGDLKNLMQGEVRLNDTVLYSSPNLRGLQFRLAGQFKEDGEGEDGSSAAITYRQNGIYLAAAMDSDVGNAGSEMDVTRLAAGYSTETLSAGLILNSSERSDGSTDGENSWLISGAYTLDKTTLKAQYGQGDEISAGRELLGVGADYSLAGKTKVFAYYAAYDDDANVDTSAYGLGLEHKF